MGAETIGSIITPASRAALYALKPTVGMQDISGMYSLTEFFDSPGPMAKSSGDLITLTEILLAKSYQSARAGTWDGLSVGFLDPRVWKTGEEMVCRHHEGTAEQMVSRPFFFLVIAELTMVLMTLHSRWKITKQWFQDLERRVVC